MITSTTNPQIKLVRQLQAKRNARKREGLFVIEGTRLLTEAIESGQSMNLVLYTEEWTSDNPALLDRLSPATARMEAVSPAVLASCSDVETPQGVLALVPLPSEKFSNKVSLSLLLDRIADPGNLGTILRTAAAAGCDQVLLTSGTVDAYNPKVVRAGMGAHFNLTIVEVPVEELLASIEGTSLWVAEARQGTTYHRIDWREHLVLAIGSEAHGLDPRLIERSTGRVHIPTSGETESLNAAAATAVLLFEIRRQRES